MKAKQSRRLVIDACVARSAGVAERPISRSCREFLLAVLDICHRAVFTQELSREWKDHGSPFALRWRSSMIARKKIDWFSPAKHEQLRAEIEVMKVSDALRTEIRKDVHLVEAALEADQIIVSYDERTARLPFCEIAVQVRSIRHLVWVNPTRDEENAIEWLRDGAPPEESRRLTR